MATAYHQPVDAFNATPDGQQIFVPTAKYNSYRERQYAPRMNPSRSSSYNDYPIEKQGFDNNIGMSPDTQQQQQLPSPFPAPSPTHTTFNHQGMPPYGTPNTQYQQQRISAPMSGVAPSPSHPQPYMQSPQDPYPNSYGGYAWPNKPAEGPRPLQ